MHYLIPNHGFVCSVRSLMRAVQIHRFGGPEVLQVVHVEVPQEKDNEVSSDK